MILGRQLRGLWRPKALGLLLFAALGTALVWRLVWTTGEPWVRDSRYVAARDGTRLALDVYRPARRGEPLDRPLPVVWTQERYHRAELRGGRVMIAPHQRRAIDELVRHGYVVAIADLRGAGASFGTRWGPFTPQEALDAYDLTEWFAAQPWCDGNVGMFGRSYSGAAAYFAASTAPPHLKAIFAEMAMFDMYSFSRPGGVFRDTFARNWGEKLVDWDTAGCAPVPGHEADLARAHEQHRGHKSIHDLVSGLPFRDSLDEHGDRLFHTRSPSSYVDAIRRSGVAVYQVGGWFDMYTRDAFAWFAALDNPIALLIGPWNHTSSPGEEVTGERLRWFDQWLKGVDTGILDEPRIRYQVVGSGEWRTSDVWPPAQARPTSFFLSTSPSDTIASAGDGSLAGEPAGEPTRHDYQGDPSTTSGPGSRWANGYGARFTYGDMAANDAKCLTYTSALLSEDLEVSGHPLLELWISCDQDDVDLVVYLEEVNEEGQSRYVTEGVLRASHRALAPSPPGWRGLPFHRGFAEDVTPLPDGPQALELDLYPTSNLFDAGHRLRLVIACADRDNLEASERSPLPRIGVHCGGAQASCLTLPVVGAEAR